MFLLLPLSVNDLLCEEQKFTFFVCLPLCAFTRISQRTACQNLTEFSENVGCGCGSVRFGRRCDMSCTGWRRINQTIYFCSPSSVFLQENTLTMIMRVQQQEH